MLSSHTLLYSGGWTDQERFQQDFSQSPVLSHLVSCVVYVRLAFRTPLVHRTLLQMWDLSDEPILVSFLSQSIMFSRVRSWPSTTCLSIGKRDKQSSRMSLTECDPPSTRSYIHVVGNDQIAHRRHYECSIASDFLAFICFVRFLQPLSYLARDVDRHVLEVP